MDYVEIYRQCREVTTTIDMIVACAGDAAPTVKLHEILGAAIDKLRIAIKEPA